MQIQGINLLSVELPVESLSVILLEIYDIPIYLNDSDKYFAWHLVQTTFSYLITCMTFCSIREQSSKATYFSTFIFQFLV